MNNLLRQLPIKIERFLPYPEGMPPLESFREIHLNISGGQRLDGPPENEVFFDWPETESHLEYLSRHFDLPLVTSIDEKGFLRRIEGRGCDVYVPGQIMPILHIV